MVAPAKEEEKNRNVCIFFSTSRERSHILESFVFLKRYTTREGALIGSMFLLLHPQLMIMAHQVIPIQFHARKF